METLLNKVQINGILGQILASIGTFSQAVKVYNGLQGKVLTYTIDENTQGKIKLGEFFKDYLKVEYKSGKLNALDVKNAWKVFVAESNESVLATYQKVSIKVLQDRVREKKDGTKVTTQTYVNAYLYDTEKGKYEPFKGYRPVKVDPQSWTGRIILDGLTQSMQLDVYQSLQVTVESLIATLTETGEVFTITGRDENNRPIYSKVAIPDGKAKLEFKY